MNETATLTITEFLLQRFAEDEAVANEQRRIMTEQIERGTYLPGHEPDVDGRAELEVIDGNMDNPAIEIGSARVLAECEAKRRIVEMYREAVAEDEAETDTHDGWVTAGAVRTLASTLRHLARPYADRPDYRDEWRP